MTSPTWISAYSGRCRSPGIRKQLQWYLDEYRTYYKGRPNQALDGRSPQEYADEAPAPEVIDIETIRKCGLVRRSFAHGLLNSYELVKDRAAQLRVATSARTLGPAMAARACPAG